MRTAVVVSSLDEVVSLHLMVRTVFTSRQCKRPTKRERGKAYQRRKRDVAEYEHELRLTKQRARQQMSDSKRSRMLQLNATFVF